MIRFRYSEAAGGPAVELGDLQSLREAVAEGRVRDDTWLADALTGEAGPARTHSAYRLVVEILEPELGEPGGTATSSDVGALEGLELTLAEPDPSAGEEAIQDLRREKERDRALGHVEHERLDLRDRSGPAGLDLGLDRRSDRQGEPREATSRPEDRPAPDTAAAGAGPSGEDSRRAPGPSTRTGTSPRPRRPLWESRPFSAVLLLLLVVAGASWFVLRDGETGAGDAAPLQLGPAPTPLAPGSALSARAAGEGVALQYLAAAVDSLAAERGVRGVPAAWLDDDYFAHAVAYPQVREHWRRYLDFVGEVRERDVELFRASFVREMQALDVPSSVVSLRVAQAVRRFEQTQPARDSVFDGMERLAQSALELHDLLVANDEALVFAPSAEATGPRDPFLQVQVDNPALREEIWTHLDRIFEELEGLHGGERWNRNTIADAVMAGLRDSGAPAGDAPGGSDARDGGG